MEECQYIDSDIPERYLKGDLDAAAGESFEEHYFACDRCWTELQIGMAVRDRKMPARTLPVVLSIAATLVIVVSAVIFVARTPEEPPTYRGTPTSRISISTAVQANGIGVRWNAIASASWYVVTVFAADGTELQRMRTTAPALVVPPDGKRFVRIEAFDSAGEKIATSSLQPLEATK